MSYITELSQANEVGLLVPGLGIEHFLDLVMDEKERRAGLEGGTPRTIEGPLYVAGAPLSKAEARLDQDPEKGEVLFMEGQVRDINGKPLPGAIVDVWHANTKGGYSFFDPSQTPYNLRGASRPTARAATFRSLRPPAMVARRTARRSRCSTCWAGTASGRRTSISSSTRRATAS